MPSSAHYCVGRLFPTSKLAECNRQMTIESLDTCCSNSEVWSGELMVFIITSPFPFHFLYKLVQVTCWVPSRMAPRDLLRDTCKTHNSAESLQFPPCSFLVLSGVSQTDWCFEFGRRPGEHLCSLYREREEDEGYYTRCPRLLRKS